MLFLGIITQTVYNFMLIIVFETEEREFIHAMKDKKDPIQTKNQIELFFCNTGSM